MKIIVGYRVKKTYPNSPPLHTCVTYKLGYLWSTDKEPCEHEHWIDESEVKRWPEFWEPIMIEKDIITDKQF